MIHLCHMLTIGVKYRRVVKNCRRYRRLELEFLFFISSRIKNLIAVMGALFIAIFPLCPLNYSRIDFHFVNSCHCKVFVNIALWNPCIRSSYLAGYRHMYSVQRKISAVWDLNNNISCFCANEIHTTFWNKNWSWCKLRCIFTPFLVSIN